MNYKQLRENLGIKQSEAAADIECSNISIVNIEHGRKDGSLKEKYRHYLIKKTAELESKQAYINVKHFDDVISVNYVISECCNFYVIAIVCDFETLFIHTCPIAGLFKIEVRETTKFNLITAELIEAYKIIDALNSK